MRVTNRPPVVLRPRLCAGVRRGRPVAIVAAYVDQTATRDTFYRTFVMAAVSLCLLAGLSFGLPAIAWYYRTREKQQADQRIRFLAHHDVLTGPPNRATVVEH